MDVYNEYIKTDICYRQVGACPRTKKSAVQASAMAYRCIGESFAHI